jgi:predicted nucleotidyltransferase
MIIQDDLKEFFQLLNENNVEYVIVGGYAVAFHGFVRATKDIDVLFHNTPANIKKLMAALTGFGIPESGMDLNTFSEQGRIVRMGTPPLMIELINAVGGVSFETIWQNKVVGNYGDVKVFFISRGDLLTTKKSAGRPQDIRDLKELEN